MKQLAKPLKAPAYLIGVSPLKLMEVLGSCKGDNIESKLKETLDLVYIQRDEQKKNPHVLIHRKNHEYETLYNPAVRKPLEKKVIDVLPEKYAREMINGLHWIQDRQARICGYLHITQLRYIKTRNPMDLVSITLDEVGEHLNLSTPTVSRLMKDLTARLPDDRVIFVDEMLHNKDIPGLQAKYMLGRYMQDPEVYSEGRWKASDERLAEMLQNEGINVARRAVGNYRRELAMNT